ncbi:MAG: SUMF1/EgtB/PvdO family nonheme iron enzyme [Sedimentisphaerales bacterium]|nr:SUMF1/EgtB/PvdO family nonheme iron enzyme [Sedimentisphaerales bacterium]
MRCQIIYVFLSFLTVSMFSQETYGEQLVVPIEGITWKEYDLRNQNRIINHMPENDYYAKASTLWRWDDTNGNSEWEPDEYGFLQHNTIAGAGSLFGLSGNSEISADDIIEATFVVSQAGLYSLNANLNGLAQIHAGGNTFIGKGWSDFDLDLHTGFYQSSTPIGVSPLNLPDVYHVENLGDTNFLEDLIVTQILDTAFNSGVGTAIDYYKQVHTSGLQQIVVLDESLSTKAWLEEGTVYTWTVNVDSDTYAHTQAALGGRVSILRLDLDLEVSVTPDFPIILSSTPENDNIAETDINISVIFNKEMDTSTFTNQTISVTGSSSQSHSCSFSFDSNNYELTINPDTDFTSWETVTITMGSGVKDIDGNPMPNPWSLVFDVFGPSPAPALWLSSNNVEFAISQGYNPDDVRISIDNSGSGTMNDWTASVTSGFSWLRVNGATSTSGTAPSNIYIGANSSSLSKGTYNGNVQVSASGAQGSPKDISVKLIIGDVANPGSAPVEKDTWLDGLNPYTQHKTDQILKVGQPEIPSYPGQYSYQKALIKFDLGDIGSKEIASAQLVLHAFDTTGSPRFKIKAVANDWSETVTEDNFNSGVQGVEITSSSIDDNEDVIINVYSIVRQWSVNGSYDNHGFLIYQNDRSGSVAEIASKEHSNSSYHPRLYVRYIETGPTDLEVTTPSIASSHTPPFYVGDTVSFSWTAINHGPKDIVDFDTGIYLGTASNDMSNELQDSPVDGDTLSPGETEEMPDSGPFPVLFEESDIGTLYLVLKANTNTKFTDTNPSNDIKYYGPFEVKGKLDFSLSVEENNLEVVQGESVQYRITIDKIGDFSSPVMLSASNIPPNVSIQIEPATVTPYAMVIVAVNTSEDTPVDNYAITLTGSGGGRTHDIELNCEVKQIPLDYHFEITRLRYGTGSQEPDGWWNGIVWPPSDKTLTEATITLPDLTVLGGTVTGLEAGEPASMDEEDVFGYSPVSLTDIENTFTTGIYLINISCSDGTSYSHQLIRQEGNYPDWPEVQNPQDLQTITELPLSIIWTDTNIDWIEISDSMTWLEILPVQITPNLPFNIHIDTLGLSRENCLLVVDKNSPDTCLGSATLIRFSVDIPPDSNSDEQVDLSDYKILAEWWMHEDCWQFNWCENADMNHSNDVDMEDFLHFVKYWLYSATDNFLNIEWVYVDDPGVTGHEGFDGYVSKYETTNAQFATFLNAALTTGDITIDGSMIYGANGSNPGEDYINLVYFDLSGPGYTDNGATNGGAARINYNGSIFTVDSSFEDHPVSYVSWYGATAFCNYYGYRLLTEWEWQAVADYDGSYKYGCGPTIDNNMANYRDSVHPNGTTPVGSFGAYGYGLCDLAGNVWEWTSSCYNQECDPDDRIFLGGCWPNGKIASEVTGRYKAPPDSTYHSHGFRVCR